MKTKDLLSRMMLLLAVLLAGAGTAWADEVTFDFTQSNNYTIDKTNKKITYGDVSFSYTVTGTDNLQKQSGLQWGAKSTNAGTITLSTSAYSSYKISKIQIQATSTAGYNATVSVGGNSYVGDGNNAAFSTTSRTNTYTGSSTGDLVITFSQSSTNKNVVVQKITITYEDATDPAKETPTLSFPDESYSVDIEDGFTAPTLTNEKGVTVKYSSSKTSVATVDESTGVVTLVGKGTTTITAAFEGNDTYNSASASYDLTVTGVDVLPFTQTFTTSLGEWTQTGSDWTQNSSYGAVINATSTGTYDLVSPVIKLDANKQINVAINHTGNKLNSDFKNECKLMVKAVGGDWEEVEITTWFTNNNWTYVDAEMVLAQKFAGEKVQFALRYAPQTAPSSSAKWEVKTFKVTATDLPKTEPTLAFAEESYSVAFNGSLTITATSSDSEGAITYTSSNTDVADINATTGVVTPHAGGTTTITATIAETEDYAEKSITVTLTVTDERGDATLTFSPATLPAMIAGEDETELTLTTNYDGTITATSSDDEVATITANGTNAWTIKAIAKGNVTFTFTGEATANFKPVKTTLNLTISANNAYKLTSTVTLPSNGEWPALSYGTESEYTIDGITFSATQLMKSSGLQFKKNEGILASPIIKSEHGYSVIVITSSSAGTGTLTLQIGDEDAVSINSKTTGIATTTSTASAFTIKNNTKNACNIDKIIIMPNLYVTSYGWATHITPAAVTFAEGDAYVVTEASVANGLQMEAVTSVPANTPVLLKGEGVKNFTIAENATAPEKNLLSIGTGAAVEGQYPYVLAKDGESACFKQWTGDIAKLKGRVVLLLDEAVAAARAMFVLGDAEATAISAVESNEQKAEGVYNLNGQRISQPAKGLYIVNGKKVFMNK